MSATLATRRRVNVESDPLKDVRHRAARAYPTVAHWLDHLDLEGKATRTLYEYERTLAFWVREIDTPAPEWTPEEIVSVLRAFPLASRAHRYSILSKFFGWLVDQEILTPSENPLRKVPRPKIRPSRYSDTFTDAERAVLEADEAPHGQRFTILFGTGIRKGEAIHLKRAHVDVGRAKLMVFGGKGGKDRVIPLLPEVQAAVADLELLYGLGPEDYIWGSRRGGGKRWFHREPIGETTFATWYEKRLDLLGVRYLKPHTTRHTFATWWRKQGLDLDELQLLLGHESIRTTSDLYVHTSIEDVARRMVAISEGIPA